MHVDTVPSKQLEGGLRQSRSQDDLTSSSQTSPSEASSAERSPHTEPVTITSGAVCVTGCEFDDADCWSQEDDDIIQVTHCRFIVLCVITTQLWHWHVHCLAVGMTCKLHCVAKEVDQEPMAITVSKRNRFSNFFTIGKRSKL